MLNPNGVDISKVIGRTPSQYARRLDPDRRRGNGGILIVLALMFVGALAFVVRIYTEVR